jgi:Zn-dependent protease
VDAHLWALLPMWFVAFLLSLTCHEAAHALAAKIGGDSTAADGGQVSLNPLPHMKREPIGTLVVPLVTYFLNGGGWMLGWASAPYDPSWAARHPRRAAWMALAGPGANLGVALLVGLVIKLGLVIGLFTLDGGGFTALIAGQQGATTATTSFLSILFTLNLLLFSFNLLPVPPLDGHSVVGLFLSESAARRWAEFGRDPTFNILGLLLAWKFFGYVWGPIFGVAYRLLLL